VNEYTRREEVRWTLIASLALVLCMAPAVFLLVTAQGRLLPDAEAKKKAQEAGDRVGQIHTCFTTADKLFTEVDVFKASAKAAHLDAVDDPATQPLRRKPPVRGKPAPKDKEPDGSMAWPAAQSSLKQAKLLAAAPAPAPGTASPSCRQMIEAVVGARPDATPGWEAINKAAEKPASVTDSKEQIEASRLMLKLLGDAPISKVRDHARDAEAEQKKLADQLQAAADKAVIREPIPEGVIPRRIAVGIGVGLSVITLLLSYLSVRVASVKRLATLIPLREAAKTSQPGLHAAAVLRLAAQHNGGLPGMVIGAAIGGIAAALIMPADTDVFIVGVMAGCIIGLALQWVYRAVLGASRWRARAGELADVEKPAIPIVLVLSGVNPGLEGPFISFFSALSQDDAALTVEKLAAQAEEKILAAADAGAAAAARQQPQSVMPEAR
jgi:hypothetical protein